jgi:MT-A70
MDFGRTSSPPEEAALGPTESASENALLPAALADFWAGRVRASMRKTFTGVLETGQILIRAQAALPHGQWLPMLKKAGLRPRTAQVWMAVVRNPRFANASPDSLLPPCVTTLNEISRLPEDLYRELVADGTIHPTVSRAAIKAIICGLKQKADEERILNLVPVAGKFRTIVIDAPWATALSRGGRACPYATMSQQQLLDLPIPKWLEDDAHVYLWTLDGELRNAFALFDHWGIEFKQILAWNKTYPSGIPRMGLGYHFRNNVEYIPPGTALRGLHCKGARCQKIRVSRHHAPVCSVYLAVRRAAYTLRPCSSDGRSTGTSPPRRPSLSRVSGWTASRGSVTSPIWGHLGGSGSRIPTIVVGGGTMSPSGWTGSAIASRRMTAIASRRRSPPRCAASRRNRSQLMICGSRGNSGQSTANAPAATPTGRRGRLACRLAPDLGGEGSLSCCKSRHGRGSRLMQCNVPRFVRAWRATRNHHPRIRGERTFDTVARG